MNWIILIVAGLFETGFAFCLGKMKEATGAEYCWWGAGFLLSLALSMTLLAKATQSLPIGTAYPVWTGIGAVGTVLAGILFLNEPATFPRIFFLLRSSALSSGETRRRTPLAFREAPPAQRRLIAEQIGSRIRIGRTAGGDAQPQPVALAFDPLGLGISRIGQPQHTKSFEIGVGPTGKTQWTIPPSSVVTVMRASEGPLAGLLPLPAPSKR